MVIKQPPRVWTGYMNFSPDLVSRDFAEPRAQSLQQQANRNQTQPIKKKYTKK